MNAIELAKEYVEANGHDGQVVGAMLTEDKLHITIAIEGKIKNYSVSKEKLK